MNSVSGMISQLVCSFRKRVGKYEQMVSEWDYCCISAGEGMDTVTGAEGVTATRMRLETRKRPNRRISMSGRRSFTSSVTLSRASESSSPQLSFSSRFPFAFCNHVSCNSKSSKLLAIDILSPSAYSVQELGVRSCSKMK